MSVGLLASFPRTPFGGHEDGEVVAPVDRVLDALLIDLPQKGADVWWGKSVRGQKE